MTPADTAPNARDEQANIASPLGRVVLSLEDDVSTAGDVSPDATRLLPRGGRVATFRSRLIEASLTVGEISPRIPPGMTVAGCVAAVWRVRALQHLRALSFGCSCPELPANADGGPTSGEGLDALTWKVPGWVVSIGTEDGEYLSGRATRGDGMPTALAGQLSMNSVVYAANGMRLPLTSVRADDVVQVQFLVAWAARPETEDEDRDSRVVSPWFAVDQRHAWVLAQLEAGPV